MEITVKKINATDVHSILVDNQVKFYGESIVAGLQKGWCRFCIDCTKRMELVLKKLFKDARIKIY